MTTTVRSRELDPETKQTKDVSGWKVCNVGSPAVRYDEGEEEGSCSLSEILNHRWARCSPVCGLLWTLLQGPSGCSLLHNLRVYQPNVWPCYPCAMGTAHTALLTSDQ